MELTRFREGLAKGTSDEEELALTEDSQETADAIMEKVTLVRDLPEIGEGSGGQ